MVLGKSPGDPDVVAMIQLVGARVIVHQRGGTLLRLHGVRANALDLGRDVLLTPGLIDVAMLREEPRLDLAGEVELATPANMPTASSSVQPISAGTSEEVASPEALSPTVR